MEQRPIFFKEVEVFNAISKKPEKAYELVQGEEGYW
jgi:hypothetical protein